MVEEQVDEEVVAAHLKVNLPPNISEPGTQFEKEISDVIDQGLLDLPLTGVLLQTEEIELAWIFERLAGEVGLRGQQRAIEIRDRFPLVLDGPSLT